MNIKMIKTLTYTSSLSSHIPSFYVFLRSSSSSTKQINSEILDIAAVDEKPLFDDEKYTENEIMAMRCKSRLNEEDRNILFNKLPYKEDISWHHHTVKYKKRMLGRYGFESLPNVNPGICWPSKEEIEFKKEYENVSFPWKLQEAWKILADKRKEEEAAIRARDDAIDKNMKKVDKWKKDFEEKLIKKTAELLKAKQRRERLLQEVRQHFGFKIDTKDERFKQLLEQKEKEESKAKKAAKKEEKMKRYLEKITQIEESKKQENSEKIAEENK